MTMETRYTIRASTPQETVKALAEEVRRRIASVPNTDHAFGEKNALENMLYMLEHVDIEA